MTSRWAWLTTLSTISTIFAAIALGPRATLAQQPYFAGTGMMPMSAAGQGMAGPQGPMSYSPSAGYAAYGVPGSGVMPAGYAGGAMAGGVMPGMYQEAVGPAGDELGGGMPGSEYGDDAYCPPGGRRHYPGNPLAFLAPYSDGGHCGPRWFDVSLEAVYLKRDKASSTMTPFTSLGFNLPLPGASTVPAPTIVLSSDDLKFRDELGMRVTGVHQVGPGSDLEISYLGMLHGTASSAVYGSQFGSANANSLWSPFSSFGTNPPGIVPPIGFIGYGETDRAYFHAISLTTSLNTVEMDYRRRWMGPGCLFQGFWLTGFRYFQVQDNLLYNTRTNNLNAQQLPGEFMDYTVSTVNNLYGWQLGGDLWACLTPGWNVGLEGKGGIYGNDAQQKTQIVADTIPLGLNESAHKTEVAFEGEISLLMTYRLNPKFTIRGGYFMMWADGLALGADNFNAAPPNAFATSVPVPGRPQRVVTINDSGTLFWSGWTVGGEYMW